MTSASVTDWWDNGANQIAFGRGDRGFVVINKQSGALTRSFKTSLAAGRYCDVISGDRLGGATPTCAGATVTVDATGNATITAPAFGAAAIHVHARLDGATPPPTGTVTVTFNEAADTSFGENIFVTGSIAALATWTPGNALPLTRISGSGTRGNWQAVVALPAATAVEYKYIKKDGAGNVTWESGNNRTLTTGSGGTTQSTADTWR
jgi:alpha-amylase